MALETDFRTQEILLLFQLNRLYVLIILSKINFTTILRANNLLYFLDKLIPSFVSENNNKNFSIAWEHHV